MVVDKGFFSLKKLQRTFSRKNLVLGRDILMVAGFALGMVVGLGALVAGLAVLMSSIILTPTVGVISLPLIVGGGAVAYGCLNGLLGSCILLNKNLKRHKMSQNAQPEPGNGDDNTPLTKETNMDNQPNNPQRTNETVNSSSSGNPGRSTGQFSFFSSFPAQNRDTVSECHNQFTL